MKRSHPDVSVIVCTYNRGELLRPALESLLDQDAGDTSFEVIVVDNNSTDDTRRIVEEIAGSRLNWRYIFEPKQGLSFARNAATAQARAPILAFTDDDCRVAPDWVAEVRRALDAHPEVDFVGGRVLPRWNRTPPSWLTRKHWIPLAVVDHGDDPFEVTLERPWCMVGANFSIRADVLRDAGGFGTRFQRVKDGIGSTEDHELQFRLWRAGRKGMYVPEIRVDADVQNERLHKAYHRRWHAGHARYSAMMQTERVSEDMPELFGIPACYVRGMLEHAGGWMKAMAMGKTDKAFTHENKIRFVVNYFHTPRSERAHGRASMLASTARGIRELARRKLSSRHQRN